MSDLRSHTTHQTSGHMILKGSRGLSVILHVLSPISAFTGDLNLTMLTTHLWFITPSFPEQERDTHAPAEPSQG